MAYWKQLRLSWQRQQIANSYDPEHNFVSPCRIWSTNIVHKSGMDRFLCKGYIIYIWILTRKGAKGQFSFILLVWINKLPNYLMKKSAKIAFLIGYVDLWFQKLIAEVEGRQGTEKHTVDTEEPVPAAAKKRKGAGKIKQVYPAGWLVAAVVDIKRQFQGERPISATKIV